MASLNINSLLVHIDEFQVFMNESDIDIISINETKLNSTINDNEVYIYPASQGATRNFTYTFSRGKFILLLNCP